MRELADIVMRAEAYKDDLVTPVTLFINYPATNNEAALCGVLFDDAKGFSQLRIEDDHRIEKLQLRATSWHTNLWIPRMRLEHSNRDHADHSFRGVAELLIEGELDNFSSNPGKLNCYVLLQDNPLFTFHDEQRLIKWSSPFGEAKMIHNYRFGGHIRVMSERKPSQHDIIEINLNPTQYQSLEELILRLSDYLDELMWLISFFSKKYIHWYQFDMFYEPVQDGDHFRTITAYREPVGVARNPTIIETPGFENHPGELLIDLNTLRDGVSQTIFKKYVEVDEKTRATLRHLITTIMATYTDSYFEQDLGMIYVAMEILVSTYTQPYILTNGQFDKLRHALKEFLGSQSAVSLADEEMQEIHKKLPELRRLSYASRLRSLFKDKLDKISEKLISPLPEKVTPDVLMERLIEVVKRRDEFIHQGKILDHSQSAGDLALIRFVVSLYLLSLLDYPLDKINFADSDLSMVYWSLDQARKYNRKSE